MTPRTRKKGKKPPVVGSRVSGIDDLPDAVLEHILGLLPVHEAVRTCVLARRWYHLWKFTTRLHITRSHPYDVEQTPVKNIREFVDQVLLLRGSSPIDECDISLLYFEDEDMPSINQWIRHVIMCKVQVLTLTIFKETDDEPWQKLDERPLISQHLRKLKLFHLWFNESFIDLSSCPALEELEIDSCYLASVDGISSLSLKRLSIGCSCILGQTFRNQIYVPNLVSLQLDLDFDRVPVLEEMPSLEEAVVNIRDSEFDCCYRSNSGNCDYEGCDHCYEIEGDSESCVLLQGLSKAKKLTLKSDIKTVQLPIKSSFSCFSFLHFHHEYFTHVFACPVYFSEGYEKVPCV